MSYLDRLLLVFFIMLLHHISSDFILIVHYTFGIHDSTGLFSILSRNFTTFTEFSKFTFEFDFVFLRVVVRKYLNFGGSYSEHVAFSICYSSIITINCFYASIIVDSWLLEVFLNELLPK
jgi:hypothetical protein